MAKLQLYVYYGWSKITPMRKREELAVIYTNCQIPQRLHRGGYEGVGRFMHVAYVRKQTDGEMQNCMPPKDVKELANWHGPTRCYTEYSIFMDDPKINNSLDAALKVNSDADRFNVSERERKVIAGKLRDKWMELHPDYKEPCRQLSLFE